MRTWRVVVPVLILVAASCFGNVPMVGRPTPAPNAPLNPRNPQQRGAALAYAAQLSFAEDTGSSHVYHGQYDWNLLDTAGTVGWVAPEIGMHRMKKSDLQAGAGRIQLRVRIQPGPNYLAGFPPGKPYGRSAPGAKYQFPAGVSYVWVDSMVLYQQYKGDTAGTAKIVVIPADTALAVDTATVWVFQRPDPENHAIARWSPAQCWDCMRQSWCALN